jgi:hypothetical protein
MAVQGKNAILHVSSLELNFATIPGWYYQVVKKSQNLNVHMYQHNRSGEVENNHSSGHGDDLMMNHIISISLHTCVYNHTYTVQRGSLSVLQAKLRKAIGILTVCIQKQFFSV